MGSWMASLIVVPVMRYNIRQYFSKKSWWGIPTIFFGNGKILTLVQEYLVKHPEFGLIPMGYAFPSNQQIENKSIDGCVNSSFLIHLETEQEIKQFVNIYPQSYAFVLLSKNELCRTGLEKVATTLFSSIILVSEDFFKCGIPLWVRPLEIDSFLCLKVRQNLLDPRKLFVKRCIDLILSIIIGILTLPLIFFIAVWIRLESPGPIFFRQLRIGREGKPIWIVKFRTMVQDAEQVLQKTLAEDKELRNEWKADQKLRYDPRVTRVGRLLRQTSLDELPQIWNVLCGDMSLVGPRPVVEDEVTRYGDAYALYIRVRPGITGLWQVSGRNDLTYSQRVQTDWYYISNWSVWLDIVILARTIPVVVKRKGAY